MNENNSCCFPRRVLDNFSGLCIIRQSEAQRHFLSERVSSASDTRRSGPARTFIHMATKEFAMKQLFVKIFSLFAGVFLGMFFLVGAASATCTGCVNTPGAMNQGGGFSVNAGGESSWFGQGSSGANGSGNLGNNSATFVRIEGLNKQTLDMGPCASNCGTARLIHESVVGAGAMNNASSDNGPASSYGEARASGKFDMGAWGSYSTHSGPTK